MAEQKKREISTQEGFIFPPPPQYIEPSILKEAAEWQGLDEFDALAKMEECVSLEAETARVPMSCYMWAFTYTSRELRRCRIHLNSRLPRFWQSFALFHEIHHLLHDSRGCYFWSQTNANMNSYEYQADQFAWAVLLREWSDGAREDGEFDE